MFPFLEETLKAQHKRRPKNRHEENNNSENNLYDLMDTLDEEASKYRSPSTTVLRRERFHNGNLLRLLDFYSLARVCEHYHKLKNCTRIFDIALILLTLKQDFVKLSIGMQIARLIQISLVGSMATQNLNTEKGEYPETFVFRHSLDGSDPSL